MEALFYEQVGNKVRCNLCPHFCLIPGGKTGICKVRRNVNGKLMAETWGNLSAVNFDPVEKKPLYHYYPGRIVLSLGSVGCNMKCKCCQNWQISQVSVPGFNFSHTLKPVEILAIAASRADNIGVAYTYNEPGVWYEYMIDIARQVHANGLKNVMVSNGFICREPLRQLLVVMDAFNIDLKGFTDDFYRKFTGAQLSPVLDTLKQIRNAGKHLEITSLVIPEMNDDPGVFRAMTEWIAAELGTSTVLHLSRYHPVYNLAIEPTPADLLNKLYSIARRKLSYVYIGNISVGESQDTHCSHCGEKVIVRQGYRVIIKALRNDGSCKACGNKVLIC